MSTRLSFVVALISGVFLSLGQAEATTLSTSPSTSPSTPRECFRNHLREAMAINRERRPLYTELSDGQSTYVSNRLIFLEQLVKASSYIISDYDRMARPYQEAGIMIVCDEYIDMKNTPEFRETFANGAPNLVHYKAQDAAKIEKALRKGLDEGGFAGVHEAAGRIITRLEEEPRFNCLLRHTLESIARIAWLAPGHVEAARAKGLPSPAALSEKMIRDHFLLLSRIARLDTRAAKVQAMNVPIICQDVPHIPWR